MGNLEITSIDRSRDLSFLRVSTLCELLQVSTWRLGFCILFVFHSFLLLSLFSVISESKFQSLPVTSFWPGFVLNYVKRVHFFSLEIYWGLLDENHMAEISPSRILRFCDHWIYRKIKQTPQLANVCNCCKFSPDFGLRRIPWHHRNAHSVKERLILSLINGMNSRAFSSCLIYKS